MLIYIDDIRPSGYYINKETLLGRLYFFDGLDVSVTNDINEYLSSTHSPKVATLYNRFFNSADDTEFMNQQFDKIKQNSDLVFIIQTEMHGDVIAQHLGSKVIGVLPGLFNNELEQANNYVLFKNTWADSQVDLYRRLPEVLERLTPYVSKPFYFDALIGSPRSNRQFVYNTIINSEIKDKFLVTTKDKFVYEDGTIPLKKIYHGHGSAHVEYLGVKTMLGFVIPISLYNQSCYSIVAETDYNNNFTFFTEKTIKPMVARRLFVTFSGQHNLRNLKSFGFKTFDSVINESYDSEPDTVTRFNMAWDQVVWLCSQPQDEILSKIHPILEHNYNLVMSTDWNDLPVSLIRNKLQTVDSILK